LLTIAIAGMIYSYPSNSVLGCCYFLAITLVLHLKTPSSRLPRTVWIMLVPTLLIFGLVPWISVKLGFSGSDLKTELVFGATVMLKTVSVFLLVITLIGTMSTSLFLGTLRWLHVPDKMVFMLMIAARYFYRFAQTVRMLGEARLLRLHGRFPLRGITGMLQKLTWEAVGHAEAVYIAVRLRGGRVCLPLLVEPRPGLRSVRQPIFLLLLLTLPWAVVFSRGLS